MARRGLVKRKERRTERTGRMKAGGESVARARACVARTSGPPNEQAGAHAAKLWVAYPKPRGALGRYPEGTGSGTVGIPFAVALPRSVRYRFSTLAVVHAWYHRAAGAEGQRHHNH